MPSTPAFSSIDPSALLDLRGASSTSTGKVDLPQGDDRSFDAHLRSTPLERKAPAQKEAVKAESTTAQAEVATKESEASEGTEETEETETSSELNAAEAQQVLAALLFQPLRRDLRPLPTTVANTGEEAEDEEGVEALSDSEDQDAQPFLQENIAETVGVLPGTSESEGEGTDTEAFALPEEALTAETAGATVAEASTPKGSAIEGGNETREGAVTLPDDFRFDRARKTDVIKDSKAAAEAPVDGSKATTMDATVEALATQTTAAAKNAEAATSLPKVDRTRGLTPVAPKKDKFLIVDKEQVASSNQLLGTNAANQGETSMSPHRQLTLDPLGSASAVSARVAESEVLADTSASTAAQAVQVVQDVREISASLGAHRRQVSLQFDFGSEGKLDVRVEVRNGEIKTEFRTDSTEVRQALQQAWNSQGLAQEGRSRLSEPAFLPAANRDAGSQQSFADAQARQQRQAPQGDTTGASLSFSRGPAASAVTPLTSSSTPVVASDRQLLAFA